MIELYIFDIIIAALLVYLLAITAPIRAMFFEFYDKQNKEQDKANIRWTMLVADLQARETNMQRTFDDSLKTVITNENTMWYYMHDNFSQIQHQIIDSRDDIRANIERNYSHTYDQFDYCRKKLDRIEAKLERDKRRKSRRTNSCSGRYFRRLAM